MNVFFTMVPFSPLVLRSPCPSLWVGNVTVDLTEKHIWDLFKTCGEIESIRVLHERFCAFVNFKNANMAARALERLQGVELESTRLVIRYPDRWMQRTPLSPQRTNPIGFNTSSASQYGSTGTRTPINGDECFFWRTTGCFYGDKCRFKHKPDQRGRVRKPCVCEVSK
ncbi:RNA-binding protein SGN1-like [Salmo trutta]|uniref:RNA-binding protein SGN1-like n=1 Tax=Salmo trutta TaxID=8032 RepID=UPI00113053AF|nr:RNA-binding protein SGN1-like [Salmo trutta]